MRSSQRSLLRSMIGSSCLATLFFSADARSAPSPEEILVTARKTTEVLAEVPLAVTVLEGDELRAGDIDGLDAVAARVPGLYFESMWGGFGSAPVMRGQAQPSQAGDNVGVFVDGVYQANRTAVDIELLDLERIEVVRGPQSALFGRSTFAGAIHYISRAPTSVPEFGATLDGGTDGYYAIRGHGTGPVLGETLLARVAAGLRSSSGTDRNAAAGDRRLGGFDRRSASFALTTGPAIAWKVALTARLLQADAAHPPVAALTSADYNCGARDPVTGAWSYWCGAVPVASHFDLSTGLPESTNRTTQLALSLEVPVSQLQIEAETTYYRSTTTVFRDFDASSAGQTFGVCTIGDNCAPLGGPQFVNRLVSVNSVSRLTTATDEVGQELRLRGGSREWLHWMIGTTVFRTRESALQSFGFARGDLAADEQLTALLPATPDRVGPLSRANQALVDDPRRRQIPASATDTERRVFALFGATTLSLGKRLQLAAELRSTWERLALDNALNNFRPGFGRRIDPVRFHDVTPRLSASLSLMPALNGYLSLAKGSRSGGINPVANLLPVEQSFSPEYNWTYELGLRYQNPGNRFAASASLYYIDWRHTQIAGFATTPGVTALITRNTAGITTRGLELGVDGKLLPWMRVAASVARVDPRFRAGSEDPGSSMFCGITPTNLDSSFCTIGPSRTRGPAAGTPVPYIDGNLPGRTPRLQWQAVLAVEPPRTLRGWRSYGRFDVSYQDAVYDRPIDGARFGERTLMNVRLGLTRGPWSVEAWVRNLGDERYVRGIASRGANFFPTTPRPLDLVQGDGRRIGLSFRVGT